MNIKPVIIFLILILILIAIGYLAYNMYFLNGKNNGQENIACTEEAKICPDGSAVGRIGPDCEFALCPTKTVKWKVYKNNEYNFELSYPEDFFDPEQQPKLLIGDCNYKVFPSQCPNIDSIVVAEMALSGADISVIKSNLSQPGYWDVDSQEQVINNTQYCLRATGDAATGRAFNYYYYTTVKNEKCLVVYMAVTTENCDFYLPLEPGNIEQEDNYNNCVKINAAQPILLKEIISTFTLVK